MLYKFNLKNMNRGKMKNKDKIFASPMERVNDFNFGTGTAKVFDDMLSRSVPFYEEVQFMIAELAANFVSEITVIYDLGCSTGTTMAMLGKTLKGKKVKLIGIDYSEAMINKARKKLQRVNLLDKAEFQRKDLNENIKFKKSNIFIMNLSLQFVRPFVRNK